MQESDEENSVPFLSRKIPNIYSAECYLGWKLALIQPWRQLSDLSNGFDSLQAAFNTMSTSANDTHP